LTSFALAATYLHQKLPLATLVFFLTTVCSDGCHHSSVCHQSTQLYVAGHGGPSPWTCSWPTCRRLHCDIRQYEHRDGDALAELYDDTITDLLDKQVPVRHVICCRRTSSTWFHDDCRRAKRTLRSMERATRHSGLTPTRLPPRRGASRDVSTSLCSSRNILTSGPHALSRNSHSHVDSGGRLTSCLVAAEHLYHLMLTQIHCIVTSTTRSPAFVHLLTAPTQQPSRQLLSAVNSGFSHRSH